MNIFNWLTIYVIIGGVITFWVLIKLDVDKELDKYKDLINPNIAKGIFVICSVLLWPPFLASSIRIVFKIKKKHEDDSAK